MNSDLALLETIIVVNMRPHFLAITKEEDYINIVVSHPSFILMDMADRVSKVFDLIKIYDESLLINNVIVVQAFCADEMDDLFEFWVTDENNDNY